MGRRKSYKFNNLVKWLIKYRNTFTFSGKWLLDPKDNNKHLVDTIVFDREGETGKKVFNLYESQGILVPTKHPRMLYKLIKTKASITFQIKQWAESRAAGELGGAYFSNEIRDEHKLEDIITIEEYELLPWMVIAVETQKNKYY